VGGVPVDPERRALEEPTAKRSGAPSPLTSTTTRPRWLASDSRPVPDRPVTGGYTNVATVIEADFPLVAQVAPGTLLRFAAVTLEEAVAPRSKIAPH